MTIFDKIDEEKELMTIDINKETALPTLAEMGCKLQSLLKEYENAKQEAEKPLKKELQKINAIYKPKIEKIKELKEKIANKILPQVTDKNLPVKKKLNTEAGIVYIRETLDFKVENLEDIPREYLTVDTKKIKEALKMGLEIPGVKKNEKFTVVFKSS